MHTQLTGMTLVRAPNSPSPQLCLDALVSSSILEAAVVLKAIVQKRSFSIRNSEEQQDDDIL